LRLVHSCLILDIRKETNGRNVNLDQTELSHFVGRDSNEGNWIAGQIEMDLGGIKELGTYRSWIDSLNGGYGIGFDAPNQTIQEVVELENLIGSSHDIGPLGERGHVGSVGCDAHAMHSKKRTMTDESCISSS
jgi:hypothetical protein